MARAFPGAQSRAFHRRRLEDERNPTKGRTAAQSVQILRTCNRFAENINNIMDATGRARMPWFPVFDVITNKDDDAVIDWRAVAENWKRDGYEVTENGMLVQMQDPSIKASNRIEAVVVYAANREEGKRDFYMTRKTLFSPIPDDNWIWAPLTAHQWSIIALAMIESRVYWQWEAAVNDYAQRHEMPGGYVYQYIVGWNMVKPGRPSQQPRLDQEERELWTGPIIYSLAITGSFKLNMTNGCLE